MDIIQTGGGQDQILGAQVQSRRGGGPENRVKPPRTKTEPNCVAYIQGRVVVAVPILSVMARALGWRRMWHLTVAQQASKVIQG